MCDKTRLRTDQPLQVLVITRLEFNHLVLRMINNKEDLADINRKTEVQKDNKDLLSKVVQEVIPNLHQLPELLLQQRQRHQLQEVL